MTRKNRQNDNQQFTRRIGDTIKKFTQLKLSEADRARGLETFDQLLLTGKNDFNVADVEPS